jgi:hypothetical protein
MSPSTYQTDHAGYLALASELLGAPARAIDLDWSLELELFKSLRLEVRRGLEDALPMMEFDSSESGHELLAGIERYRLPLADEVIRVVRVVAPRHRNAPYMFYAFWAVPVDQYLKLYRHVRRMIREQQAHVPPILQQCDRQRLWDNTIGFLRHGCQRWKEYGVPAKRGVLLLGEPGNGKTMACRWLRGECNQFGLEWHNVSSEEYDQARNGGKAHELFELSKPGIVFFDDVDMAMRDRNGGATTSDHSTFLGGLDGIDTHLGVVYLFTSNAQLQQLDPAFRRPGRIDVIMQFPRPDAVLRRRLIDECWHAELRASLDVDQVVAATEGLSFAEMEEVKKLLVMHYFDSGNFDWPQAWHAFRTGRGDDAVRRRIGFVPNLAPIDAAASLACVSSPRAQRGQQHAE